MKKMLLMTVTILSLGWAVHSLAYPQSSNSLENKKIWDRAFNKCTEGGKVEGQCTKDMEEMRGGIAGQPPVHEPFFGYKVFDVPGAVVRALETAIKYFLSDDSKMVAQLAFKGGEGEGEGGGGGGCGGVYKPGSGVKTDLVLSAITSPLTDIFAEVTAYPDDIKVQNTSIWDLAKYRVQSIVKERASLDQLSAEQWAIRYRAQQRAIRALTDALVMKKAYKELAKIGEQESNGSFADYGEASSTAATRRLLFDSLLALRKRVIAARVRARAEMMEMDLQAVPTAPSVEKPAESFVAQPAQTTESSDPKTVEASGGDTTGGNA